MQQVSDRVYVETAFRGCNVGVLVTSEGLVLIDSPQHPVDALKWRSELEGKGPILYVINTEHHLDHVVGNHFFPGVVVSTQGTRDALDRPGEAETARDVTVQLWPESSPLLEGYALRIPTVTFTEQLSLFIGDRTLHLIHLPGHVPGGLAVHIPEEKVVFTGDNVVRHFGPAFHEALPAQWLDSLKQIEALGAEVVVPGHGPVCDNRYIPEFARELDVCIESVKGAIKRGLTREEAASQIDFLRRYEAYGIALNEIRREHQREGVRRLYDLLTAPMSEDDNRCPDEQD